MVRKFFHKRRLTGLISTKGFLSACIFLVSVFINNAGAQSVQKLSDSLYSEILEEQRNLQIVLPANYKPGAADKYDVIYVLDGEWNTEMVSQIHQYTTNWRFIPQNIIVGINNTYINGVNQRDRDLTPTHNDNQPISGKATNFVAFIKKELIPYINKKYPTTGDNTLFGHSHGGTATVFTFLTEPTLFKSYIAADPSLWWDNGYMSKFAADKLPGMSGISATLHISGRAGSEYAGMGIDRFDSVLKEKAPKNLLWESAAYPNEIHNSVKLKGIYDGLKLAYRGYTTENISFHPMNGIMLKDKPTNIYRNSNNNFIHYTTNGSEPGISSPIMDNITVLNGPAVLKAKPVSARWTKNKTFTGHFREGQPLKTVAKPKKAVPGGFSYAYYKGDWDKLPEFAKLKPEQTGITDKDFNPGKLPRDKNYACLIDGYVEIKEAGYYIFGIDAHNGLKFYLHNQLLIDYDGVQENPGLQSFLVPLDKGFYPLRLEYFLTTGNRNLEFIYLAPGKKDPTPIPLDAQYHK